MTVRDLKLAIVCEDENDEVKSLNIFFDELFSDLTIYTEGGKPDLIFMKGDIFIMQQDLENDYLLCRYDCFWRILRTTYHCTYTETQEIIQYKVEEAFKMGSLTPLKIYRKSNYQVEEAFKSGLLTPVYQYYNHLAQVEEAFKSGLLTPSPPPLQLPTKVEEAFKIGSLTPITPASVITIGVEEAFKSGLLTPRPKLLCNAVEVEEAFKSGLLTPLPF